MSVVELEQLTYTYADSAEPALRDVDLSVDAGEFVVLAGGSGSGKSTLLRLLCGLVPHFHGGSVSGSAVICGFDVRDSGPGELAAEVGTVLQDPETQVVMGTVRSELAFPLENRGWSAAAVARGVEEAALALGIPHLLDRPTGELSGGELQRVALGAGIAGRPRLLCLDEPTSQLDPVAGDELIGLLRRLGEDLDTAILLAEHRLERCLPWADRVIVLGQRGEILCDRPPAGFLEWAARAAPELQTPGAALLSGLGLAPAPGVRAARRALRERGLLGAAGGTGAPPALAASPRPPRRRRPPSRPPALALRHVWHELRDGPRILQDVTLELAPGERVALMGRNGAGKSTLLRHAAGLMRPSRGSVSAAGRVALLLQNPSDYLVHSTVGEEAPARALGLVGLDSRTYAGRHPRDLSGGERQRLALAVVLDAEAASSPAVVCLDEPTRGMDRADRRQLADLLGSLDAAVLLATHDPEFAASCTDRVVLLAEGRVIADGPVREVLSGGSYFATETARILGGAGGALLPQDGIRLLTAAPVSA